jgi:5'-nucleotidase
MRILVTNDDGVEAPGIAALARGMASTGHDVTVVAPLGDRSGSGAGIGPVYLEEGVPYEEAIIEGLDAPAFGVDAMPAFAVLAARLGAFGEPPDVIVSGVNPGHNTGRAVLHSGTVGAALTAANFGARGMALSVGWDDDPHFDTAVEVAIATLPWIAEAPPKTVLNINVPGVPVAELKGVAAARLAPFGTVRSAIVGNGEGRLQVELHQTEVELDADTDTALVAAGFVAVTSLTGIGSVADAEAPTFIQSRLPVP